VGEYGLGTVNQNLPGFVVIKDSEGTVVNGCATGAAAHAGSLSRRGVQLDGVPIKNLETPKGLSPERQREKLDLLAALNRDYGLRVPTTTNRGAHPCL